MSLPKHYTTAISYFDDVAQFLKTYEWIYNYPNTEILLKRIFEKFPLEWVEFFENIDTAQLNNLSIGIVSTDAPESLTTFLNKINSFKPQFTVATNLSCATAKNLRISKKKNHEIELLAPVIHDVCNKVKSEHIIDIGSGLGYLPELLHKKHAYNVLGLEGNPEKLKLAIDRQNKLHADSKPHVKFHHHFVTSASAITIKNLSTATQTSVLTGLHACADLSITVQKLFLELDFVKGLVIMPCCYHRLKLSQESTNSREDRFENFPVSKALREVYSKVDGGRFLRRYFLRLACQQSVAAFFEMDEKEHKVHAEQCLFRAILEATAREENCHVSRNKRKTRRPPQKDSDSAFEHYVHNLKTTHTLTLISADFQKPPLIDSPSFQEKMHQKWREYKSHCGLVEVLTALQMAIQSVCENLVLLDRVEFLRENGGVECGVYKVTDDRISPRCHALVATKL